jgi:hypothetical protein
MSAMMHPTRRDALLQSLEKPHMVKAKLDLNFLESGGKLVRLAYQRAGMSQKEAMAALGIDDPAQFNRMLAGKEKLWMHQFLRPEAQTIWKELIFIAAQSIPGMTVERVVRLVESA